MTADSNVAQFIDWVARTGELHFDGYEPLRRWPVEQLEDFWAAVRDFHDLGDRRRRAVPSSLEMNGARWFARARLNYAERVLGHAPEDRPALPVVAEGGSRWTGRLRSCAARSAPLPARPRQRDAQPSQARWRARPWR